MLRSMREISVTPGGKSTRPSASRQSSIRSRPSWVTEGEFEPKAMRASLGRAEVVPGTFVPLGCWGLLPGEHGLLELIDRVMPTFQAKPPQLQQHGTCRRVDEVVPQRYLHDRTRALRDGDEARRIVALQLA